MSFTGLVPAEYSSGERTRRGSITKALPGRCPHGADRGGLVLPVPACDRRHLAPPPARRGPADPNALLADAAPAVRLLRGDDRPRQLLPWRSPRWPANWPASSGPR